MLLDSFIILLYSLLCYFRDTVLSRPNILSHSRCKIRQQAPLRVLQWSNVSVFRPSETQIRITSVFVLTAAPPLVTFALHLGSCPRSGPIRPTFFTQHRLVSWKYSGWKCKLILALFMNIHMWILMCVPDKFRLPTPKKMSLTSCETTSAWRLGLAEAL